MAEAVAAGTDVEPDEGVMPVSEDGDESSSSGDSGRSGTKEGRRRRRRGKGSDADEEEDEADEEERDTLETLCSAFRAGEHHLLPLEMKVQALEYLVERALEVWS